MSDNYSTEQAITFHHTAAAQWRDEGPDALWDVVRQLDPEFLAVLVMLHTGATVEHG